MKAFLYIRKSDKRHQKLSFEKQEKALLQACEKDNIEVVEIYHENESWSKKGIRKVFYEMLKEVEKRYKYPDKRIDIVYVFTANRLSRNIDDTHTILTLLDKEIVAFRSIEEDYDETPSWKKRLRDALSEAIKESEDKSIGWWPNMDLAYSLNNKIARRVPYWYSRVEKSWSIQIIQENEHNQADIVRLIFKEFSSWKYSYRTLSEYINSIWYKKASYNWWVLKLSHFTLSDIWRILKNAFYYWKVVVNYNTDKKSKKNYFEWSFPNMIIWDVFKVDYSKSFAEAQIFEPLISEALYIKCQNINKKKSYKSKITNKETYLFNWISKCSCRTDQPLSLSGYHKKWHYYYKCSSSNNPNTRCSNPSVSEHILNEFLYVNYMKYIHLTDTETKIFSELFKKQLKSIWLIEENAKKTLDKEITQLEKEKQLILDRLLNVASSSLVAALEEKFDSIDTKIKTLNAKKSETTQSSGDLYTYIDDYLYFIRMIWNHYMTFPRARQKELIWWIFEYIIVEDKKIIDLKINPVFEFIINRKKSLLGETQLDSFHIYSTRKTEEVLTLADKNENQENKSENWSNSLIETKKTQPNDCVLYGRPTRNRT